MIQIPLKLEDLSGRFLGRLERFTGFVSLKPIYTIYNIYEKKSIQEFGSSQNFSREKNLLFECIEHNLDVSTFFVLPICFSKGVASNHPASIHGDDDFSQTTQVPTQSHPPPPPPKRWWQLKYFWSFHPETLGKMFTHFVLAHIFQLGWWFNHQPVTFWWLGVWLWMCQLGWNHQPESCYATGHSSTSSFIHPSRVQLDALAELRNGKEGGQVVSGWRLKSVGFSRVEMSRVYTLVICCLDFWSSIEWYKIRIRII